MYFCVYVSLCFAHLGPTGVGLNELKRKLLISDPQHFSVTIPRKSLHICVCVRFCDSNMRLIYYFNFFVIPIPCLSKLYLTHSSVPSSSAHSLPPASRNTGWRCGEIAYLEAGKWETEFESLKELETMARKPMTVDITVGCLLHSSLALMDVSDSGSDTLKCHWY